MWTADPNGNHPGVDSPERTPDGRYVLVNGRRWRASDPHLPEDVRERLVSALMAARREIGAARRRGDRSAESAARRRVQEAKEGLGERGTPWWEMGPDARRRRWRSALRRLEGRHDDRPPE